MNSTATITKNAINHWELIVHRITTFINQRSDETLVKQIAPGKNTGTYIIGHLIALNEAMLQILGIGKPKHPELWDMYFTLPDGTVRPAKSVADLRQLWVETHDRISVILHEVPDAEWFQRHANMTDEEFIQNPLLNKLSVLLNRTTHMGYHLGQLVLL